MFCSMYRSCARRFGLKQISKTERKTMTTNKTYKYVLLLLTCASGSLNSSYSNTRTPQIIQTKNIVYEYIRMESVVYVCACGWSHSCLCNISMLAFVHKQQKDKCEHTTNRTETQTKLHIHRNTVQWNEKPKKSKRNNNKIICNNIRV